MNNQTFFLIIIVLVLIYYLPKKNTQNVNTENQNILPTDSSNQIVLPTDSSNQIVLPTDSSNQMVLPMDKTKQTSHKKKKSPKNKSSNNNKQVGLTQELINDYLSETNCEENFDIIENFNTMGPNTDIGNNMEFKQQQISNPSQLANSLSNSLVPDFEPSYLNINPSLNSFGYATNNPEADRYYENRGFMNPNDGRKYADSVQWMLAHPFETRYCNNMN
jgi:hypothetical protein